MCTSLKLTKNEHVGWNHGAFLAHSPLFYALLCPMSFKVVGLRDRGRQTGRFNWVHLCLFTRFYRVSKRDEISVVLWEKWDQLLTSEDKPGHCENQITQQVAFLNSLLDWEVWNWAFISRRGETNDLGSIHRGWRIRKWKKDDIYGCCSVTQSCLTLCDPMDCSTPDCHYFIQSTQQRVCCPISPAKNLRVIKAKICPELQTE